MHWPLFLLPPLNVQAPPDWVSYLGKTHYWMLTISLPESPSFVGLTRVLSASEGYCFKWRVGFVHLQWHYWVEHQQVHWELSYMQVHYGMTCHKHVVLGETILYHAASVYFLWFMIVWSTLTTVQATIEWEWVQGFVEQPYLVSFSKSSNL